MAWNEPGGSGGKDPWGGRKNDQTPPDLDEVFRKIRGRFGGLFGSRSDTGSGGGFGGAGLLAIAGIVLLIWGLSGIYIVDEGKRGIVLHFGKYHATTLPGPHWYPRFVQSVEIVDVESVRSVELGYRKGEGMMLTNDENLVDVQFAVQYRVDPERPQDYLFNLRDPEGTLREATESAVRQVIGETSLPKKPEDEQAAEAGTQEQTEQGMVESIDLAEGVEAMRERVLEKLGHEEEAVETVLDLVLTTGRSEIASKAQILLQEMLDGYNSGLVVTRLSMQNAQAPEEVQDAFADAVKAREDRERLINEALAYANDIVPKAEGQAARIVAEAEAYKARVANEASGEAARFEEVLRAYTTSPGVTRERLYIEAMESVLGNSSKVLVDTADSNNLLYLPLDRLMDRGAGTQQAGGTATDVGGQTAASQPQSGVDPRTLRTREDLRRREVR